MTFGEFEPRDAGAFEAGDFTVSFEDDMAEGLAGAQRCTNTCRRTVCTFAPCCISIV
jgi:hypothetical protein